MFPILFSIGAFHFYSLSLFLILSWVIFSFVFWKLLREEAVPEEKIFDLTFYATLSAIIGGRVFFIILNPDIFGGSLIKMLALWVVPGLSFWGALVFAVAILTFLSRRKGVRLGYVLDALSVSLPLSFIPGAIGAMLDGAEVGLPARLPWAVSFAGYAGSRHPLGLYEIIIFVLIAVLMLFLRHRAGKSELPYGLLGIRFFLIFIIFMFGLEFFKVSKLYFKSLSANQWIMVGIFGETIGAFYVRGGGREKFRPVVRRIVSTVGQAFRSTYEKLFKRSH